MAAMNGSVIPAPQLERLDAAATPEEVASIGVEAATEICERLLAAGVPGIHLYPMNRSESVRRIVHNLDLGR
jgi:methylenetetrahydrofolate reductase (NADPH)